MMAEDSSQVKTKADRLWIGLGKVALLLGVILSLGQVIALIHSGGPDLKMDCRSIHHPHSLIASSLAKEKLPRSRLESQIRVVLEEKFPVEATETIDALNATIEILDQTVLDSVVTALGSWPEEGEFFDCKVENDGDKPAKEVVVVTPLDADVVFVDGTIQTNVKKSSEVQIGDLRPGDSISVRIWSFSRYWGEDFRLIHSDGIGKFRRGKYFFGLAALVASVLDFFIGTGVLGAATLLLLTVQLAFLGWLIRYTRASSVAPEEATQPDDETDEKTEPEGVAGEESSVSAKVGDDSSLNELDS